VSEFSCSVCGWGATEKTTTFRLREGDTLMQWTVPVRVCTNGACLRRQGAVAVPVKELAS
jgi:hypothetical protein